MKRLIHLFVPVVVAAACGGGGGGGGDDTNGTDGGGDGAVADFTPGCEEVDQTGADAFSKPEDFGAFTPGTLASFDPNGRWFLTGTRVGGVSSFFFERNGTSVIVDRDPDNPGTITADTIFQRTTQPDGNGGTFIIAKRVSNLLSDGSLRADRAVCDGSTCRHCVAKMIRATHNNDEGEGDKLTLLSNLNDPTWGPGYTFNVRVRGNIAYLIRQDGLHVIDTTDPAHPVEKGHYKRNGDGYSNDVKIVDAAGGKRFAIIADFPVDVVDVTNPAAPTLAGTIPEEAHTLFTETRGSVTRAYFGNYDGSCPVYDVTNPAAPTRLGRYQSGGSLVHDLSIENGIAYLNAWETGFHVVDFNTPASPKLLGKWAPTPTETSHSSWTTTINGKHIALHGEEAYGANLNIVDVDPTSPTFMQPGATFKTRDFISIHNLMAFGSKAYFTYYQDGVRVLDLSNPAAPQQVGYYNTWDPQADYTTSAFFEGAVGLDVDLTRKLIFVADSPRGLLILRDDTP